MKYCDVCGGDFYVQERWDGSEWRLLLYNDTDMSPEDVNCEECPMYLPLAESDGEVRIPR